MTIPPDDPAALARQVVRLIDDPTLARRLGMTGAEMVRQRFDERQIIAQVEAYLVEILAERRPAGHYAADRNV